MSFPFTSRGIADWATRLRTGVLIYTLLAGFITSSVVGWFIWTHWLPVWESAMTQFPAGSVVEKQILSTTELVSNNLANNRFLSISMRTDPQAEISSISDIRIILDTSDIRVGSLFGYLHLPYPAGYIIELDSEQVQPWWLSRSFFFYIGTFALLWGGFSVVWRVLAALYLVPSFIVTYLMGRRSTLGIIFRLNLLSLIPPALFMTIAVALYGMEHLNLQEFLVANAIHIPMGWIIMLLAARELETIPHSSPKLAKPKQTSSNPFDSTKPNSDVRKPSNPFSSTNES